MSEIAALMPLGTLTAGGLLAIAVLMVLTDQLVTKGRLREKDRECERWRKAYEVERETNSVRDKQMMTLTDAVQVTIENSETTVALLRAMRPESGGDR